ncbi:MAG: HD domain-containing protein [Candidatus Hydrogenedentes bacterium]|nr:HD domain-containing protein [Candidatus Hydrogenedentota bacterium]
MTSPIGSLAWTRAGGGVLTAAESRTLFKEVLLAQLTLIPEEWLHKLSLRRAAAVPPDLDALTPPDSALARAAESACRNLSPEYLFNHCARSYAWGRIFGAQLGLKPDPELLYLAAMYHDMGLTETHGGAQGRPACFSLIGADVAAQAMTAAEYSARAIDTVCEAITLHLNIGVDLAYGPEAHLLNLATAVDTTGLRLWRMPKAAIGAVLARHPRCNQNELICACWKAEAARFPQTRAGWLEKNVQFSGRLRKAPLR